MKVFLSSSSESKNIAEFASEVLADIDGAQPRAWWYPDVFTPGISFFEALTEIKNKVDCAIVIFSEDDQTYSRGKVQESIRDNILIEYGLLSGELSRKNVLVLVHGDPKIPLNLWGMNFLMVDKNISRNLFMAKHSHRIKSWYETVWKKERKRSSVVEMQKEVFAYVFNRLNPYQNITLTLDFLRELPSSTEIQDISYVLHPMDRLMHNYVNVLIESWMRIYFAYKIESPYIDQEEIKHPYCIGISCSVDEDAWMEGNYIVENSNIGKVYRTKLLSIVRDATISKNASENPNFVVKNEGSVVAFPVLFADGANVECLGVIGINSPKKREVTSNKYQNLIKEVSVIFSSLFYSYGKVLLLQNKSFEEVVKQLRLEIEQYFPYSHS